LIVILALCASVSGNGAWGRSPEAEGKPTLQPWAHAAPRGDCTELGVSLWMPRQEYRPGDHCQLIATVCNPDSETLQGYPLFVILELAGQYWFAPSWVSGEESIDAYMQDFPPGESLIEVIPEFFWPEDAGDGSGALFWGALTDPAVTTVVGELSTWEFSWTSAPGPENEVTIHRDVYGVPHVFADTEYEVFYGLGYAMAQDQLETFVPLYRAAAGRRAAYEGAGANDENILADYVVHLFRVPESAAAAYAAMDSAARDRLDGFTEGINAYVDEYNEAEGAEIEHFTPEDVIAWAIHAQYQRQLTLAREDMGHETKSVGPGLPDAPEIEGSNQWVVAPERGAGAVRLLADPHLPWFGSNQWYEAHLEVLGGGLKVAGAAILGTPMIAMGHNRTVAWSMTNNGMIDYADCYKELLVTPNDLSAYVFAAAPGGAKPIVQQEIVIEVLDGDPVTLPAYYTHHGPVYPLDFQDGALQFTTPDGQYLYTLALSIMGGTLEDYPGDVLAGMLDTFYRFGTASNVHDIKLALGLQGEPDSLPLEKSHQLVKWNIVVGDSSGDIFYIFNGRIPIRSNPHFDDPSYWDRPLEGWTGNDEWQRDVEGNVLYWPIANLPQVENPDSGFLVNCNVSPWYVCPDSGIDPDDFPPYVCTDVDTFRNVRARELLESDSEITDLDMRTYAMDVHLIMGDKLETLFFALYESDPGALADLQEAYDLLQAEPNEATKDNRNTALISAWMANLGKENYNQLPDDPAELNDEQAAQVVGSLRQARNYLESCPFGLDPRWGEIHMFDHGAVFELDGGTHLAPTLYLVGGDMDYCEPIWCNSGSSFMQVTELTAAGVSSRSVRPLGSSADPDSPHYADETARYAERNPETSFKPNPFSAYEVVTGHLESTTVLSW
jgi:acyl-homoserine lactone acylase PvdQ